MSDYAVTAAPIAGARQRELGQRQALLAIRVYRWLADKPMLACATVFVLTLGIRAALLPWMHAPQPSVHDEFSYLLAADTYASGRLANPPHRYWEHFETFQVLQQPTYASKYQPMQGLVLAFGQRLFGQPWAGVFLSAALMCAAICWMLQGWISPGAALLGGLLFMLRIAIFSYWMNSYWGGAVPAIGGALIFGALGRIIRQDKLAHGSTLAIGLAILLNSRPYEGAVLGLLSIAVLAWWFWRKDARHKVDLLRLAWPAVAILAVTAGCIAYNNYRVTGDPLLLPYQAHDRQYAVASMFAWSKMRPEPVYHHAVMRKFWAEWHVNQMNTSRADLFNALIIKIASIYDFCFGLWPLLVVPLIWPIRRANTEERLTVFFLFAILIAIVPLTGFSPHYAAAFVGVFYLRMLQSLRRLWMWRPSGRLIGLALAAGLVLLILGQFGVELKAHVMDGEYAPQLALQRDAVVETLQKQSGRHLVLVRYAPTHYVHHEWVYNRADIDAAPIVWAREMGPDQDRPLIEYFHGRTVWLLEPDQTPPRLSPYSSAVPAAGVLSSAQDSVDGGRSQEGALAR